MTVLELQSRLAEVIDMLLTHYPLCLRVLVGETEPPTAEEIEILCTLRRNRGKDSRKKIRDPRTIPTDEVNVEAAILMQSVEQIGGWRHIATTTRKWIHSNPVAWLIVTDYVLWIGGGNRFRKHGSMAVRIAAKFGIHRDTLGRYRREFPEKLAEAVLKTHRSPLRGQGRIIS